MRQQRGKMKKLALALLALMMVVCLGACGGGEEESVEEVMRKSQENMAALSSMTYTMDMNMGISAAGQSLNVATLATMDYTVDPFAIKGELSMDMGELGAMELSMYAVENEDGYVSYMQMPGDPTWYKQPLENMETLEQYDARENLDLFLSSSKSFQEQGTEEINGVETVRYDGVLSNDVIDEVLTSYGTLDQLGMSAEDVQSMISSLGDVPVSCWIDKANYMVVQYQIDMTSMMQQLMSGMLESEGAEAGELAVDAMTILLTISNTNNVEVIELPAEVENAVELPQ